jgi:hypothetical protein
MRYFGDEYFSEFLEMLKFPRALPEMKAIVMRNLWRVGFQSMEDVLKEIYLNKVFSFPGARTAELFFDNFSALWSLLQAHQEEGNHFRFAMFPKAPGLEALQARIHTRTLEIQALLPLMTEDAKAIPEERLKYFQHIASPIMPAIEQIKKILESSTGSFGEGQIAEWERELNGLDFVLEEAFNHLGWLLVMIWRENQEPDFNSINNI